MLRKRTIKSGFIALCLCLLFTGASCDEIYFIDNSPLFLYKTINWWYDSLPEESEILCGRPIKCSNDGKAQVEYDAKKKKIELEIRGGFATMLLAFKKCKQCYGPSYLRCRWLDQYIFKNATATVNIVDASTIRGFTFSNIEKDQARIVQNMGHNLQFTLEGTIGGLSNGQIALYGSSHLIKNCREAAQDQDHEFPITLKIINAKSNDTLAIFDMFWER